MRILYGYPDWIPLKDDEINESSHHFFQQRYGDIMVLVFIVNGVLQHLCYNINEVRKRKRNMLSLLHPDDTFFDIIEKALLIFMKSGKTLVWLSGAAEELEILCSKQNIVMIFIEHSAQLKKQLAKFGGDIGVFLDKQKPLPKRLDFRKRGKKKTRIILPVFTMPPYLDYNGWAKKIETAVEDVATGNIDTIVESENVDETAEVFIETTEINDTEGPVIKDEISGTLNQLSSIVTTGELKAVPEPMKTEREKMKVRN